MTRDTSLRQACLDYACRARQRAARCWAEDPDLARLYHRVRDDRRRQVLRLQGLQPEGTAGAAPDDRRAEGAAAVLELARPAGDLLVLRLEKPGGFSYRAGQHVKLGRNGIARTYSLVSAPHQPFLEFFIELQPGGAMANQLRGLVPGDRLQLGAAQGSLRLSPAHRRHLMVATVTGIAPFVSLLREHFRDAAGSDAFHLLQGASYQDEFGYLEELAALTERFPGRVLYTPSVSRPAEPRNAGWAGSSGRVDGLVADYLEDHGLSPADTAIYACGQPRMVEAVDRQWAARGFQVRVEPY